MTITNPMCSKCGKDLTTHPLYVVEGDTLCLTCYGLAFSRTTTPDRINSLKAHVEALQDLAIWMTGCGYDFTQHKFYMDRRHLLVQSCGSSEVDDSDAPDEPEPEVEALQDLPPYAGAPFLRILPAVEEDTE